MPRFDLESTLRPLLIGAIAAAFILMIAVLSPVHWDAKALRTEWISAQPPLPARTNVIFASADNDIAAAHTARYALDLNTFPDRTALWVVLAEGNRPGRWQPDLLLDRDGRFVSPWSGRSLDAPAVTLDTALLVLDASLADQLRTRWPHASGLGIHVIAAEKAAVIGAPRLSVAFGQVLRLSTFLCVLAGWCYWLWRTSSDSQVAARMFNAAVGVPLYFATHAGAVYLLGLLLADPQPIALALEALAIVVLLGRLPEPRYGRSQLRPLRLDAVLCALIGLQFTVAVLRLDFDGDLFTHWLPMARSHYFLGHHDLDFLQQRYGVAHEATYPPGFPILISTLLWIAGADRAASLAPGTETHLMVLLYRLMFAGLGTSFLIAVGALVRARAPRARLASVAVPGLIALTVPSLLGQPTSAELALVPFVGFAALLFGAAELTEETKLAACGAFLAAFLLFLKNDALMIGPLLIAPWAWIARRQIKRAVVVALVVGLLPWLTWKADVHLHRLDGTFAFAPFSLGRLLDNVGLLVALVGTAVKLVLSTRLLPVLLLVLPAAVIWLWQRKRWSELMAAGAIALYVAILPVVYVFSRIDPIEYLQTSFNRLALSATVCIWILALHGGLKEAKA